MTFFRLSLAAWLHLALLALAPFPAVAAETQPAKRPNILWISLEDISPNLGCYGDAYAVTPHIDKLASQGVRFSRAFSHAGVCAPTRSGIITGMHPTTIGTHYMRCKGVPPAHVKCFPEYLRAAGYYCTNDSKTDYNFDSPLTAWDDNRGGAHWRNRPAKDQPFFCVINLTTTHESQIRLPEGQLAKRREAFEPAQIHDPAKAKVPPYYPDTPVVRRDIANYYDNLTFTDQRVGQILADLEADGLANDTIVFFWGDHGWGMPRGKRWVYDSGIQVPLVVRWPGTIAAGSVRDDLVCFLDLAPTVLSLAGVKRPAHLQGQVFLGSERDADREYIYAARDRMDETLDIIRAVRDKQFKYIRNYLPERTQSQDIAYMNEMPTMKEWRRLAAAGKLVFPQTTFFAPTKPVEELYDTQTDPHEVHNLSALPEHKATLERLRAAHESWRRETNDLGLVPEAELNERVRPGGKWSTTAAPEITWSGKTAALACATAGASLAYTWDGLQQAGKPHWLLYAGPIAVPAGKTLQVKACRLGFRDSPVVESQSP